MDDFYFESKYTRVLDYDYKMAITGKIVSPVASFATITGMGKTAAVMSWLKHYGYKHIIIDASLVHARKEKFTYSPLDELKDFGAMTVGKEQMEELFSEKSVELQYIFTPELISQIGKDTIVFIDNYDRTSEESRLELFRFVSKLEVVDTSLPGKEKVRKLYPLMFIVNIDSGHCYTENILTEEEKKAFHIDW